MKVKANPQGHRRGIGEVVTRGSTHVVWRHNGKQHLPELRERQMPTRQGK